MRCGPAERYGGDSTICRILNNQTHLTYAIAWEWVLSFFFFWAYERHTLSSDFSRSFTTGRTKQAAYLQSPHDDVQLRIELPIFYAYSMPVRQEKVFFLCELYFSVAYCIPFRLWIRRYDLMGRDWLDTNYKIEIHFLFLLLLLLLPLFFLLHAAAAVVHAIAAISSIISLSQ